MELSFESKELRSICEETEEAEKRYGVNVAKILQNRLADMIVADHVTDIPSIGQPKEIIANPHTYYKINISEGYQLIFCANHVSLPLLENDNIDWSKVSRIKILQIKKSYEKRN